jgi:hypothetical protein
MFEEGGVTMNTDEETLFKKLHISPNTHGQARYKFRKLGVLPDYEKYSVDDAISLALGK